MPQAHRVYNSILVYDTRKIKTLIEQLALQIDWEHRPSPVGRSEEVRRCQDSGHSTSCRVVNTDDRDNSLHAITDSLRWRIASTARLPTLRRIARRSRLHRQLNTRRTRVSFCSSCSRSTVAPSPRRDDWATSTGQACTMLPAHRVWLPPSADSARGADSDATGRRRPPKEEGEAAYFNR